jgi:hypothetical protein
MGEDRGIRFWLAWSGQSCPMPQAPSLASRAGLCRASGPTVYPASDRARSPHATAATSASKVPRRARQTPRQDRGEADAGNSVIAAQWELRTMSPLALPRSGGAFRWRTRPQDDSGRGFNEKSIQRPDDGLLLFGTCAVVSRGKCSPRPPRLPRATGWFFIVPAMG